MELQYDPVEDTKEYKNIEKELGEALNVYAEKLKKEADKVYEEYGVFPSPCHRIWAKKKEILKNKYGIEWKTPAEMNPEVNFD